MKLLWSTGFMELPDINSIDYINLYIEDNKVKLDIKFTNRLNEIDSRQYVTKEWDESIIRNGVILFVIQNSVPVYRFISIQKCLETIMDLIYNDEIDEIDIDAMINGVIG